ncbi:MAG: hypothetical protein OEM05_04650 [Myxococcales bacterium]|nr:hypothetical protein [Myxococcales bacterium]
MTGLERALAAAAVVLLLAAGPTSAQNAGRVEIDVMISHISNRPGDIDPAGRKLDRELRDQFRYESLRVLESRRLSLRLDEVGSVDLPNGKPLRVRPLQVGERGVLVAVAIEGTLQTDLRIRNGHLVVIGAEPYEDGRLVISLEPHF